MWISRGRYDKLQETSENYKKLLENIASVSNGERAFRLRDGAMCLSEKIWNEICAQNAKRNQEIADARDEVMKLKSERDWYKQHYAELLVKNETHQFPDMKTPKRTCPRCGGELTHMEICTAPPIHSVRCAQCGWSEEKQL